MKKTCFGWTVAVILLLASNAFSAESTQKLVFCVDKFNYGGLTNESDCFKMCQKHTCDLESLLTDGWRIIASSPKEIIEQNWTYVNAETLRLIDPKKPARPGYLGCTCIGTQYVVEKMEQKSATNKQKRKQDQ